MYISLEFKDYEHFYAEQEELAEELLASVCPGGWQDHRITIFINLEEYVKYEITHGVYAGEVKSTEIHPLDVIEYLNFYYLGEMLAYQWDDGKYYLLEGGQVAYTEDSRWDY